MADGSVKFVKQTIHPRVYNALGTRNRGEIISCGHVQLTRVRGPIECVNRLDRGGRRSSHRASGRPGHAGLAPDGPRGDNAGLTTVPTHGDPHRRATVNRSGLLRWPWRLAPRPREARFDAWTDNFALGGGLAGRGRLRFGQRAGSRPCPRKGDLQGRADQERHDVFLPDESKGTTGPQAIGTITSDGTYILSSEIRGTAPSSAPQGRGPGTRDVPDPPVGSRCRLRRKTRLKFMAAKTKAGLTRPEPARRPMNERSTGWTASPSGSFSPRKLTSTETSGNSAKVAPGSNTLNIDINEEGIADQ